jgi:hypothetical protein
VLLARHLIIVPPAPSGWPGGGVRVAGDDLSQ